MDFFQEIFPVDVAYREDESVVEGHRITGHLANLPQSYDV